MIQTDEVTFLILMQLRCRTVDKQDGDTPRAIIANSLHLLSEKRAHYLLGKFEGKGWYEYGTVLDMGWLTREGVAASYEKEWTDRQK